MAQFGGKVPPPWQTRPQTTSLQGSLLGQHPGSGGIPSQQIVIGTAPQTPQYAQVQQSMIQPPGLGGLQTIPQQTIPQHLAQHNIPQPNICSANLVQPGQPNLAQASLPQPNLCQGSSSLMGQPPMNSQSLAAANLVSHSQLGPSQMQQIQPQVTTVAYPAPRALAPPGSFSTQGAPVNLAANLNSNIPGSGIVTGGPPAGAGVGSNGHSQPPQKQRVFTGTITKLCADFGFVDEDVFFQTSCVKGPAPKVGDRVLVEASYNPNMPFKWNANRVQVIPGPINSSGPSSNRSSGPRDGSSRNVSFNAVPPPNFSNVDNQSGGGFSSRSNLGPRQRSPRRDRRDDIKRSLRDRADREDKEKDLKRESRKRSSRSHERSRSPPRRRARIVPRYNVQVPKIILHMKEVNVLELRKRYSNLYVPSDVFLSRPLWSETFPAHRAFQMPRPVAFHIMNKEVDPVIENNAIYDPPDINHIYAAKVMLMAVPPLEDVYRRSCALSEDPSDVRSCFVHPTRLINFLVGLKGKNETMAIGGYWSPSTDGANPDKDPNVLIRTAIRTCKALTGIDLSGCTTWYRFAEIYYRRGESTHKGRNVPARVETTVLFLPDVWNICPTKLEWDGLHLNYRRQLDRRLQSSAGELQQQQAQPQQFDQEEQEEEDGEDKETTKKDPTHWGSLDPKSMKVVELRCELDARVLNSKGLKSQLIARLTKVLKAEQDKEEQEKAIAEKLETDEFRKKDEEDRKREEEKKKKEEEEKKREEEEKKKAEERERSLLEKRYTLPEQPMVVVHPSRTAKSGKFDCTTMSLSVLLDYRQEDNKEHSFEVSLFAELFNEMLMRDFAFKIYRALVDAPDKAKEEKKEKDNKERDKKEEKDDKEDKKDKKEDKEEKDEKMDDKSADKKERKPDKEETKEEKEIKKDDFDEDEEMEEEFDEYIDEEDSKDGHKGEKEKERDLKERDRKKDERRDSRGDTRREKKDKRKMVTVDPHLLLSFVYFDQTHTGYIVDKDLEDIINILGVNLSRAQLKKLVTKVLSRDVLYYRKLTDVSVEERNKTKDPSSVDLEQLARGNNYLLPLFTEPSSSPEKMSRKSPRNTPKDEPVITSSGKPKSSPKAKRNFLLVDNICEEKLNTATPGFRSEGLVKYEGSLVDISKLMQQLERSDKARNDTEEKLKELQRDLSAAKDEAKRSSEKSSKLNKEMKSLLANMKTTEEELKKVLEDNTVYQRALNQIKGVIHPLVAGVDIDDDDAMIKEEVKVKNEYTKNGIP